MNKLTQQPVGKLYSILEDKKKEHEHKFLCDCGEYVNRIYTKYNKLGECHDCYKRNKYLKNMGNFLK